MKTFTISLLLLFALSAFSQTITNIERAPQNFLSALKSDNDGLIESAIFHVSKFKIFYQDMQNDAINSQLEYLVREGNTDVIRYKAYLASLFMNNPVLLSKVKKDDYKDSTKFFRMLSDTISEQLLAAH